MIGRMGTWMAAALLAVTTAHAVPLEFWTGGEAGQGLNEAVLVLDFNPGESHAFGFRWSGTATGYGMLEAIATYSVQNDAVPDLSYTYTDWGGALGYAIDTITYDGVTMGTGGYPSDWCSYFTSEDGATWIEATTGVSSRTLGDGDWDGWAQQSSGYPDPSVPPVTPVPEPGAIALFVLGGGLAVFQTRRRQRAA